MQIIEIGVFPSSPIGQSQQNTNNASSNSLKEGFRGLSSADGKIQSGINTSSVSPLTSSSYLSSFVSSPTSLPGGVPNQQHLAQTHSLHSQLHGRLSGVNGLSGTLPSDDEDIDEDDDGMDETGDSGSSLNAGSSRDRKSLSDQLNGDKSGKPRKKKTRTVFSRSQVSKELKK